MSPTTASTATSRAPRRNKAAIIWEGEPGDSRVLTYRDLWREVNHFAAALRRHGVKKGDTVTIYMGMIPELSIAMLACARIGAPHNVVFGGFAPGLAARPDQRLQGQGRDHRRRRLSSGRHGPAQEEHRRRAEGVPAGPHRDRVQADWPGDRLAAGSGRLVGRLRQGRRCLHETRADGLRGHALPPLYVGVDRPTQGHHPHHRWLSHRGDGHSPPDLRPARGGRVLVHGRHRLGHRPLLHRLRAARQRRDHDHVRGHAGLAGQGPLLADHREVRGHHPLHGSHRHPHLHPVGRRVPESLRPVLAPSPRQRGRADQPRGVGLVLEGDRRRPLPHRRHLVADGDRPHPHLALAGDHGLQARARRRSRSRASTPRSSTTRGSRPRPAIS